jgi:hypothetical protein
VNEDWDFYALRVDDQPASIFVDLALASKTPITGTAVMVYVSVKTRAPRPDGLSSQEESMNSSRSNGASKPQSRTRKALSMSDDARPPGTGGLLLLHG